METGGAIALVVIVLLVSAALFVALREVVMWYFKINQRIELQKDLIKKVEDLTEAIKGGTNTGVNELNK